jgi:hypothetical protein
LEPDDLKRFGGLRADAGYGNNRMVRAALTHPFRLGFCTAMR